ncbi:hypothetical protein H696_01681 [Fonticula alba]|uniref:Uncharacterized protein n=1 Tax=Fonticula alba TaxID=691883 RepID=A0A058ZED3_FONAL|nr:hypothetical protein H696_01681 [Fonticula alba]KCV72283.1 hypothetical protein H696_01681 [Fonticula alba]|eukprot:XP_009493861.1 hypothetical protein H696_01681 [Fonticula alba]
MDQPVSKALDDYRKKHSAVLEEQTLASFIDRLAIAGIRDDEDPVPDDAPLEWQHYQPSINQFQPVGCTIKTTKLPKKRTQVIRMDFSLAYIHEKNIGLLFRPWFADVHDAIFTGVPLAGGPVRLAEHKSLTLLDLSFTGATMDRKHLQKLLTAGALPQLSEIIIMDNPQSATPCFYWHSAFFHHATRFRAPGGPTTGAPSFSQSMDQFREHYARLAAVDERDLRLALGQLAPAGGPHPGSQADAPDTGGLASLARLGAFLNQIPLSTRILDKVAESALFGVTSFASQQANADELSLLRLLLLSPSFWPADGGAGAPTGAPAPELPPTTSCLWWSSRAWSRLVQGTLLAELRGCFGAEDFARLVPAPQAEILPQPLPGGLWPRERAVFEVDYLCRLLTSMALPADFALTGWKLLGDRVSKLYQVLEAVLLRFAVAQNVLEVVVHPAFRRPNPSYLLDHPRLVHLLRGSFLHVLAQAPAPGRRLSGSVRLVHHRPEGSSLEADGAPTFEADHAQVWTAFRRRAWADIRPRLEQLFTQPLEYFPGVGAPGICPPGDPAIKLALCQRLLHALARALEQTSLAEFAPAGGAARGYFYLKEFPLPGEVLAMLPGVPAAAKAGVATDAGSDSSDPLAMAGGLADGALASSAPGDQDPSEPESGPWSPAGRPAPDEDFRQMLRTYTPPGFLSLGGMVLNRRRITRFAESQQSTVPAFQTMDIMTNLRPAEQDFYHCMTRWATGKAFAKNPQKLHPPDAYGRPEAGNSLYPLICWMPVIVRPATAALPVVGGPEESPAGPAATSGPVVSSSASTLALVASPVPGLATAGAPARATAPPSPLGSSCSGEYLLVSKPVDEATSDLINAGGGILPHHSEPMSEVDGWMLV